MKKITVFLLSFLFSFVLFAEQPFFLQNWIIPDDFVWSANKNIPNVPGKKFSQRMTDKYVASYVTFYKRNLSNLDFPPYFQDNKLLDWDYTYEQILAAFKDNDLFFTYDYVYPSYNADRPSEGINFLDIITITCRQDNHFKIELYFPHSKTQQERNSKKAEYCYIFYQMKGLEASKTHIPQKEIFEAEYRAAWEENYPLQKKIIALSYLVLSDYDLLPVQYDCSLTMKNNKSNPAAELKTGFSINSKDELLNYLNNPGPQAITRFYDPCVTLLESSRNKDKSIIDIGVEEDYTIAGISRLFFADSMKDKVGKSGVSAYSKTRYLLALRLGVGAGYITYEQSFAYAEPVVEELLSQYASFEDYTAHVAAGESFTGVTRSTYSKWPAEVIKYYNNVQQYLPIQEIVFNGSKSEKPLSFDDSYFKPTGEALWWSKVQSESEKLDGKELAAVKYAIAMYGRIECLAKLEKKIRPAVYDSSKVKSTSEFYNKNYKQIWYKRPENEKYAIAFSSNLFELNRQYHLDFENKVLLSDNSASPARLLEESWDITNHDVLVEKFNSLESYGHSGAYKALSDLLDKHPGKTPVQIASLENLSVLDTARLNFVKDTRGLLGEHGIEAWDEGREISIMRWGISCDYISSNEAMKYILPVINRIKENYVSFEDFICHYIIGRQFYGLYDGDYERLAKNSKDAALRAYAYIPFNDLNFSGTNADKQKVMNFSECIYTPSDSFLEWENVMALYRQKASEELLVQLEQLEQSKPEYSHILFSWHLELLNNFNKSDETIQFIEANMDYLKKLPEDDNIYIDSMYYYLRALNNSYNPEKLLNIYTTLPQLLQGNIYFYYQYAYANYLMINLSNSQSEMDYYKNTAQAAFTLLKEYNFNIGERMEGWLESVKR